MDSSYDVISPITPTRNMSKMMRSPSNQANMSKLSSASSRSSFNDNNNNNLVGLSTGKPPQSQNTSFGTNSRSSSKNNVQLIRPSDLDIQKIAQKLEYTNPNHYFKNQTQKRQTQLDQKDYEMNVTKMQGFGHNVDYVNYIYVNKVTVCLFFFRFLIAGSRVA